MDLKFITQLKLDYKVRCGSYLHTMHRCYYKINEDIYQIFDIDKPFADIAKQHLLLTNC